MYLQTETDTLFHYNFGISNTGENWEGEEEGRIKETWIDRGSQVASCVEFNPVMLRRVK